MRTNNMKDIVIIGAGGFGREVQWLIERINKRSKTWNLLGYIDDNVEIGTIINGYEVLGDIKFLRKYNKKINVVCAIGVPEIRGKIIEKLYSLENVSYPNLIDPSVEMSNHIDMGEGNIICAGSILTVNIKIGDFNIINLDCTIGHDDIIESFVTIYPSVNISGNVIIGAKTEVGTGSKIIQNKVVGSDIIIGANSTVAKSLKSAGTYVGTPAKRINKR